MLLKRSTAIFFLGLLLWQTMGQASFFWWYQLDRASFARRYCVNIDRPELQCNGACQIAAMEGIPLPQQEMQPVSGWPLLSQDPVIPTPVVSWGVRWLASVSFEGVFPEVQRLSALVDRPAWKPPSLLAFPSLFT